MNSLVEICMVHLALADEKSFGHRKLLFLSTSIIISIFFCIVVCGLISYQAGATSGPSVINNSTATNRKVLGENIRLMIFRETQFRDIVPNLRDPESICSENHGRWIFRYLRCYFLIEHQGKGLNFSQQVASCDNRNALLFYPRSDFEAKDVWKLYASIRQWDPFAEPPENDTWFLHVGFQQDEADRFMLRSLDKKTVIEPLDIIALDYLNGWSFTLNGLCFIRPRQKIPDECNPGAKRRHSICMIETLKDPYFFCTGGLCRKDPREFEPQEVNSSYNVNSTYQE